MRKSVFNSIILAALSVACLAVPAQQAWATLGEADAGQATVKSGVTTPIKVFYTNCTKPAYYGISGLGSHGKVTTKESTGRHCGQSNFPAMVVLYTSDPGFSGDDDIVLYIDHWRYAMKIHVESDRGIPKRPTTDTAKRSNRAGHGAE